MRQKALAISSTMTRSMKLAGANCAMKPSYTALYSFWLSNGRMTRAAVTPDFMAFWLEVALPASVRGPVLCWAFFWLAATCAELDIGDPFACKLAVARFGAGVGARGRRGGYAFFSGDWVEGKIFSNGVIGLLAFNGACWKASPGRETWNPSRDCRGERFVLRTKAGPQGRLFVDQHKKMKQQPDKSAVCDQRHVSEK